MKTNILLIRHAQSVANLEHILAGTIDVPITELGYKQIENLTNRLKTLQIDEVYSSDLIRAKETAKPIAEYLGKELKIQENLREMHFGICEGMKDEECKTKYKEEWKKVLTYWFPYRLPEQEELEVAANRIYNAIEKIAQENEGKTVAITAHGVINAIFLSRVLNKPFEEIHKLKMQENTNINFLEYNSETKKFTLIKEADNSHNSLEEQTKW